MMLFTFTLHHADVNINILLDKVKFIFDDALKLVFKKYKNSLESKESTSLLQYIVKHNSMETFFWLKNVPPKSWIMLSFLPMCIMNGMLLWIDSWWIQTWNCFWWVSGVSPLMILMKRKRKSVFIIMVVHWMPYLTGVLP